MTDIGFVNGIMEGIENCMTEETIMPMSCKSILKRMVYKGAMTEKECEKIMRKMKEHKPSIVDLNEVCRTCENVGTDYAECDQFVCSECGIELQDWHSVERCDDGEIIFHEYVFRYCPHCGKKIEVQDVKNI